MSTATEDDLREITVEVAEKLFGWQWVQTMGGRQKNIVFMSPQEARRYLPESIVSRPADWRECWSRDLPDYAGDIAAAMTILDRMDVWRIEKSDLAELHYTVFVAVHEGKHSSRMRQATAQEAYRRDTYWKHSL